MAQYVKSVLAVPSREAAHPKGPRMAGKILLTLIILTTTELVAQSVISADYYWYANQFLSIVQTAVILTFLTMAIPYRQLHAKTMVALWATSTFTDLLVYPLWYFESPYAAHVHYLRAALMVSAFVYICCKSYTRIGSDQLEDGYIYQVRAIPRGIQDMILSILYLRPFGGTGVVCGRYWYHYRKGILVRDKAAIIPKNKCVIIKTRTETVGDLARLDSIVGDRWTWTKNCATILYPLSKWGS